eukprot:14879500-Alexandrium_andersonii.AAC.1
MQTSSTGPPYTLPELQNRSLFAGPRRHHASKLPSTAGLQRAPEPRTQRESSPQRSGHYELKAVPY